MKRISDSILFFPPPLPTCPSSFCYYIGRRHNNIYSFAILYYILYSQNFDPVSTGKKGRKINVRSFFPFYFNPQLMVQPKKKWVEKFCPNLPFLPSTIFTHFPFSIHSWCVLCCWLLAGYQELVPYPWCFVVPFPSSSFSCPAVLCVLLAVGSPPSLFAAGFFFRKISRFYVGFVCAVQ